MNAAVTGASGHLGGNLVRALLARGDVVRALVHSSCASLDDLGMDLVRGDVCDAVSLRDCFWGADVVYHLAGHIAVSHRDSANACRVNVDGVCGVVEACIDCRVPRLVHFSSIHAVADPPDGGCIDEDTPLVSEGSPPYDRSKAEGERLALNANSAALGVVVVAPTAVVGPCDFRPSFFGRVLLAMAKGRMPVRVGGGFDWVDVRDVVSCAVAAADRGRSGVKYMASGHWCSLASVASVVAAAMGRKSPVLKVPLPVARMCSPIAEALCRVAGWTPLFTPYSVNTLCHHRCVSHARASEELGYEPRPLQETIVDTCRWFADNGYLGTQTVRRLRADE